MQIIKITTVVCLLLFTLSVSNMADADVTSCSSASSITEKAICSSEKLLVLDARLALHIFDLTQLEAHIGLNEWEREQNEWLKTRDLCKDDARCLEESYIRRIDSLIEQVRKKAQTADQLLFIEMQTKIQSNQSPYDALTITEPIFSGAATTICDSCYHEELPEEKPIGVSDAEWDSLSKLPLKGLMISQVGYDRITLLDVDGNQHRDLSICRGFYAAGGGGTECFAIRNNGLTFGPELFFLGSTWSGKGKDFDDTTADFKSVNGQLFVITNKNDDDENITSFIRPFVKTERVVQILTTFRFSFSLGEHDIDSASINLKT